MRLAILLALPFVVLVTVAVTSAFAVTEAPSPQVVATGLRNPRGLAFGPDGSLYVAEAGAGGSLSVRAGQDQVPYRIGRTARVSKIASTGAKSTVLDNLPSVRTPDDVFGATATAVIGDDLFVLTAAGGRDVQDAGFANVVLKVSPTGEVTTIANLTAYNLTDPPLARRNDVRADVEGGVPYGLMAFGGKLYATDGNLETVTEVTLDGGLRRVLQYPASNHVLVGLASGVDGDLYVAEYGPLPHKPGDGKITRLTLGGDVGDGALGFTTPIDVKFAADGSMYVLEFSRGHRDTNTGSLVRVWPDQTREVLATDLNFPTGLAIGPDQDLYFSESGHRSDDGSGRIMKIAVMSPTARVLSRTRERLSWLFGSKATKATASK